jgi:DNA-binding MarR family transcriptional regulator
MDYTRWGFRSAPFEQRSLPPSPLGAQLLVGRDRELHQLEDRLRGTHKAAVVEGLNGIGKTSVVNVAAYELYRKHLSGDGTPLYIPCRKTFQLQTDSTAQEFVSEVLLEVAQTLVERQSDLTKSSERPITPQLDRWLNNPELKTYQGGLQALVAGINFGSQGSQNAGLGFEKSGLPKLVVDALAKLFPDENDGGVVCCIDNLELLQTYEEAKRRIEELRDELLSIRGLRWVLCGALGITYAFATSTRLDGYLHRPIVIAEIDPSKSSDILESRRSAYSSSAHTPAYLPITIDGFKTLYTVLHGNLRSVLSYIDNYCQHISDTSEPKDDTEKNARFEEWLEEEATRARDSTESVLTKKTTLIFRAACEMGEFAPSDFSKFGLDTPQALRNYLKSLEGVDVIVSIRDETDKRRKRIQVTAKGWFLLHNLGAANNDKNLPNEAENTSDSSSEISTNAS